MIFQFLKKKTQDRLSIIRQQQATQVVNLAILAKIVSNMKRLEEVQFLVEYILIGVDERVIKI